LPELSVSPGVGPDFVGLGSMESPSSLRRCALVSDLFGYKRWQF
jgi:hypothetical protein